MESGAPWILLGGDGQLARAFVYLAKRAKLDLRSLTRDECDITDRDAVETLIAETRPEWVFNAAAYNHVDRAESESELAQLVNGEAPGWIADSCKRHGARMIHVSSDFVFGEGGQAPFSETDTPAPLSAYGHSKLAGEQAVQASGVEHLLVRTAWVCGLGGNNFVEKILGRAEAGEPLQVVADQLGSPTLADDLAAAIFFLVRQGHRGLFHVTNAGATSWHGFATELLALARLNNPIEAIASETLDQPARRPADSRLALDKLGGTGWSMRPWQAAFAHYVATRT